MKEVPGIFLMSNMHEQGDWLQFTIWLPDTEFSRKPTCMWWRASPRPNFWHCASEKSKKQSKVGPPNPISLAKRNNVAMAIECAKLAREILGANGITYSYPPGRHLLNLETVLTYEGTHEIHTLIVGQDITGLDAFG